MKLINGHNINIYKQHNELWMKHVHSMSTDSNSAVKSQTIVWIIFLIWSFTFHSLLLQWVAKCLSVLLYLCVFAEVMAEIHVSQWGRAGFHLGLVSVSPVPLETFWSSLITCGSLWPALRTLSWHGRLTIIDAETFVNSEYKVVRSLQWSGETSLTSSVRSVLSNQVYFKSKNKYWALWGMIVCSAGLVSFWCCMQIQI